MKTTSIWAISNNFAPQLSAPPKVAAANEKRPPQAVSGVAVIPVHGVIEQRTTWVTEWFGGSSIMAMEKMLDDALADPAVSAILLDIDSPGGSVYGVEAFANRVYEARAVKPVVALANSEADSAAYWIGASAGELWAVPGAEVGSIGVIAIHMDYSGFFEQAGIAPTVMTAGKNKGTGNPYEPLDDEDKAYVQARLDEYYGAFVGAVARGRGVSPSVVRKDYGEGRVLGAEAAKSAGMIDGVATFRDVVGRMLNRRTTTGKTRSVAMERKKLDLTSAGRAV